MRSPRHRALALMVALACACLWLALGPSRSGARAMHEGAMAPISRLAPAPAFAAAPVDPETLRRYVDRLAQAAVDESFGGASLSIAWIEKGEVAWAQAWGYADVENAIPATTEHVYRVGSVSKHVTALGVLKLVEKGAFELDDPIAELAPEIEFEPGRWAEDAPVTVAQLLEHSTGFDEVRFNELVDAGESERPADTLALNPNSRRVRWRPGTRHAYSQSGYTVAAHLIEKYSGEPWEGYLEREVLQASGAESGSFIFDDATKRRLAIGYAVENGIARRAPQLNIAHRAAGNLAISAEDTARLLVMMLGDGVGERGRVVSAESIERMETGGTLPFEGLGQSYGLGNYRVERLGVLGQSHGGWMPGYNSVFFYVPDTGRGFVIFASAVGSPVGPRYWNIANVLNGAAIAGGEVPELEDHDLDPRDAAELPGLYRYASPHVDFTAPWETLQTRELELRGERLVLHERGVNEMPLTPAGERRFRRDWEHRAGIGFAQTPEDLAMFDAGWGFTYWRRVEGLEAFLVRHAPGKIQLVLLWGVFAPLFWLPILSSRARRNWRAHWLWPSVGVWMLGLWQWLMWSAKPHHLGEPTSRSIAIFTLGVALAMWTLLLLRSQWRTGRMRVRPGVVLRAHSITVTLALVSVVAWFAAHGIVGVRTWTW